MKAQEVWFLTSDKFQSTCGQSVIIGDYIYSGHGDRDGRADLRRVRHRQDHVESRTRTRRATAWPMSWRSMG